MNAIDFSLLTNAGFGFGTDSFATASALRKLALRIESGELIVTGAALTSEARPDDFVSNNLSLSWSEKKVVLRG